MSLSRIALVLAWLAGGVAASCVGGCGDGRDHVLVTRVIDGDTIVVEDGRKIRYLLIDTPELKSQDCYAEEARVYNEQLVLNKTVALQTDVQELDKYGRTLAYVYVGKKMVNRILIEEGYADFLEIPPDGAEYADSFRALRDTARANGVGMWGVCL